MPEKRKIVIIGAGHVGSHCAMALSWRCCCDEIVLVDIDQTKAAAQALDIADAQSYPNSGIEIRAGSYADCADAAITIICIGKPRLPGQTRLDLLDDSVLMLRDLLGELKKYPLPGLVITITNPADIVADYVRRGLGLDRSRVFGTGTLLDTARLIRILHEESGLAAASIDAFALGEHGDSSMVPFSAVRIGGLGLDCFPQVDCSRVLERTRMSGMDIINGKASTEFGIGQAMATLADAILQDKKTVLPLSVLLQGEYGQHDVHCGVPCVVGRQGIERIIELPLNQAELDQLDASCSIIRDYIARGQKAAPLK